MNPETFESTRIYHRDLNQANYKAWQEVHQQWTDALSFKQFRSMQSLQSVTARYKYTSKVSKSQKLRDLARLANQAWAVYQISRAEYAKHLKL